MTKSSYEESVRRGGSDRVSGSEQWSSEPWEVRAYALIAEPPRRGTGSSAAGLPRAAARGKRDVPVFIRGFAEPFDIGRAGHVSGHRPTPSSCSV